jgi:hypothetical protein
MLHSVLAANQRAAPTRSPGTGLGRVAMIRWAYPDGSSLFPVPQIMYCGTLCSPSGPKCSLPLTQTPSATALTTSVVAVKRLLPHLNHLNHLLVRQ